MHATETPTSTPLAEGLGGSSSPLPEVGNLRPLGSLGADRLVLTVAEAGQLLGISRAFAYELIARGELPVIRLGRRVVVPKVALLEMVGLGGRHN